MKIDVTRLKENKPEEFEEVLTPEELDVGTSEVKYKGDIAINIEARKEGGVLFTKTHIKSIAEYTCSRCLKECTQPVEKDFSMEYPLDKSEQFVDITKDIREEIILDYPVKFLCSKNCRGICPKCGKDLNKEKCNCA
ncbi:MAG: DUF177 domain-containing protein [Candidatus Omnitrophica bacterium]|nr:DUF177 domain-containing protein [Candidatus Omnitrophota bacterium]